MFDLRVLALTVRPCEMAVMSHQQIADILAADEGRPITAQGVRKIEQRALMKLRSALKRKGIHSVNDVL